MKTGEPFEQGRRDVDETNPDREQYALTFDAMNRTNISPGELWLHYFSMGGGVDEYEVNAYLHGLIDLPDYERDCVAQAVNELFDDLCRQQGAPYSSGQQRPSGA